MVSTVAILFGLGVFFGLCPFLGRFVYNKTRKHTLLIYVITALSLSLIIFFLTIHSSWEVISTNFMAYFAELISLPYLFTFITYIIAGLGLIGGILEYMGEHTESAEVYKRYHKSTPIKLYFFFLADGFIFLVAIFVVPLFLIELLQWEFFPSLLLFHDLLYMFHVLELFLMILGSLLMTLKIFRFGVFSMEFYRSEFDPKVSEVGSARRGSRRLFGCVFGAFTLYACGMAFLFNFYPPTNGGNIAYGKVFFYFAAGVEAIIFYAFKERFIDQLKPIKKQYELKVGRGTLSEDEQKSAMQDSDQELQFDD
jgi:hypothetical protein